MDDVPLDDAAPNPFDAFDVFAAPASGAMALPPPAATADAMPALGSPLISFSPVAAASATTTTVTTSTTTAAVDDLLSFSPIAASTSTSTASTFLMMDDLFLGAAPPSSTVSDALDAPPASATAAITLDASASSAAASSPLSDLSPFSSTVAPPPAPLSLESSASSYAVTDAVAATRASFSGFDAATSTFVDYDAPQSAPAAFDDGMAEVYEDAPQSFVAPVEVANETSEAFRCEESSLVTSVTESAQLEPEYGFDVSAAAVSPREEATTAYDEQAETPVSPVPNCEPAEVGAAPRSNDIGTSDDAGSEAPLQSSPDQTIAKMLITKAEETEHRFVSAASSPNEDGIDGYANLADPVSVPLSTLLGEATDQFEIVSMTTVESYHERQDESHTPQTVLSSAKDQRDEETPPPGCEAVDDAIETDADDIDHGNAASPQSSGILSLSSQTHELEGFQALSGESDDAEVEENDEDGPAFDAEAVAVYAEVTETDDGSIQPSAEAEESVLHLHVRDFDSLPGGVVDQDLASPASVVSSTGSSVAGSAFAFIAAGGSSSFSFVETVQSPRGDNDSPSDRDNSCSRVGDEAKDSPQRLADASESAATDTDVTSSWKLESSGISENAESPSEDIDEISTAIGVGCEFSGASTEAVLSNLDGSEVTEHLDFQSSQDVSNSPVNPFAGFSSGSAVDTNADGLGGFGGFSQHVTVTSTQDDDFGGFGQSAEQEDDFGGFSQSAMAEGDDDGFGGFGQSNVAGVDDDDDTFGDFGSGATWGSAAFQTTISGKDDAENFDDFTPVPEAQKWGSIPAMQPSSESSGSSGWAPSVETLAPAIAAPTDLEDYFSTAFPACKAPVPTSLLPKPAFYGGSAATISTSAILEQASAIHKSFHASLQDYRSMLAGDNDDSQQQSQQPSFESEALRLKYLKYVLTEKMSEAARHDGVFPQGSEKYQMFEAIVESGHEKNMREALAQLQEALFQSSMNEAVMRIARQAALSAKARIAEQAAQQQAHARGSLLATTRNFLTRSAGSTSDKDHTHSSSRTGSGSLGVLTPTSASVHKMSRFPASQNGQEGEMGSSSGYGSGEDTGSDVSVGDLSTHSEGEVMSGGSGPPSSSSSSSRSGGLMKKFHERFTSLSSTKNRPRTVSLRRMGQSSEEVCKMELNMESINGGFDEVKWRCAGFLYETEEVARIAPSQIKIYSYPSNQLLAGKTDRSALSKFFKPGTTWTIDIGVSTE